MKQTERSQPPLQPVTRMENCSAGCHTYTSGSDSTLAKLPPTLPRNLRSRESAMNPTSRALERRRHNEQHYHSKFSRDVNQRRRVFLSSIMASRLSNRLRSLITGCF